MARPTGIPVGCIMSMRKTIMVAAATAAIFSASAASAATYDLSRQNDTTLFSFEQPVMTSLTLTREGQDAKRTTAQIGGYAVTAEDVDTAETWDFVAWCVDLFTPFRHGGRDDKSIDRYETSTTAPDGVVNANRYTRLQSFFDKTYDASIALDPILAAGYQLAIWELLYEAGQRDGYSLYDGIFRAYEHEGSVYNLDGVDRSSSLATEQAAWDAADAFIAQWIAWNPVDGLSGFEFTYFIATDGRTTNQTLLTVTPPSEVPLPAPALLLIGGLAALGAMKRRRG